MIDGMESILREHRFFAGLDDDVIGLLAGCARNVVFHDGKYLLRAGGPTDEFFLVRFGKVALDLPVPGRDAITFQTIDEGGIVGVSWLVPPHRGLHDARAVGVVRAIGMDARCLRQKCDTNHDVGYELMQRFVPLLVERLQATRLQLLDVYGPGR